MFSGPLTIIALALLVFGLALVTFGLIYELLDGHSEDYDSAYFKLFLIGVNFLAVDVVLWLIIGIAHLVAYLS